MMKKGLFTKLAAVSVAGAMAFSMAGCHINITTENTSSKEEVVNHVVEMSEEEMTERTGIDLPIPDEATNVQYSVIESDKDTDGEKESSEIAQVEFTLDGKDMYLRACMTDLTNLFDTDEEGVSEEDFKDLELGVGDISGLYYDWNQFSRDYVQDRDAYVCVSNDGPGYVAWLDVVPGILYNLCTEEDADMEEMVEYANVLFVPMQGEVEGDNVEIDEAAYNEFADLMEAIIETKAGKAGSDEEVQEVAADLIEYVKNNSDTITALNMEDVAYDVLQGMADESGDEAFVENFKECLEAVKEAALNEDPEMKTDVTFNQVINCIENVL